MTVCRFCGEDVEEIRACARCSRKFCSECGDFSRGVCNECLDEEDEGKEEETEKEMDAEAETKK